MYRQLIVILVTVFIGISTSYADNQIINVTVPGKINKADIVRNPFVDELLHIIFKKQNKVLNLVYLASSVPQGRALKELSFGDVIDLNWAVTTVKREKMLLPIRIPIYRGLIGWRVFFIQKNNQKLFDQVNNIDDLKKLTAVQRFDWPDYQILKINKLPVEGNISYLQQSLVVRDGIADYFPLSAIEINISAKEDVNKQLIIESGLVLKYPSAYYFFVRTENQQLADIIQKGFDQAINDGSYDELFLRHFGSDLQKINLKQRRVITLNNPLFPMAEQINNKKYWYQLPK